MGNPVQMRVNPPTQQAPLVLSNENISGPQDVIDNGTDVAAKTDFKSLLMNSNVDVAQKRAGENKNDLSKAKNDDEFFKMLEEKTKIQRTPKSTLGKDEFLKLFVTQLQNQDPLNPQDSAAMSAQLAQFNSLEQMMNMNKSLEKMADSQDTNRAWGLIDYVGKEVQVNNGEIILRSGKTSDLSLSIDKPINAAVLQIKDEAGVVVSTQDLGNLNAGDHKLAWDGKDSKGKLATDGHYRFNIVSKGKEEEPIPVKATSKVKITGLDLQDKTGSNFYTELGKLSLKDISAVGSPGFSLNASTPKNSENGKTEKTDGKSQATEQAPNQDQSDKGAAAAPLVSGQEQTVAASGTSNQLNDKTNSASTSKSNKDEKLQTIEPMSQKEPQAGTANAAQPFNLQEESKKEPSLSEKNRDKVEVPSARSAERSSLFPHDPVTPAGPIPDPFKNFRRTSS